jgi:hypothetical protein
MVRGFINYDLEGIDRGLIEIFRHFLEGLRKIMRNLGQDSRRPACFGKEFFTSTRLEQ